MKKNVYLDHAATTPVDQRVLRRINSIMANDYGNSMSPHRLGSTASEIVEDSRRVIANILNAASEEITFTSSATESNNTIIKGLAFANKDKGRHLVVSAIEHDCVLQSARWLEKQGYEVTYLPVDRHGLVNPRTLQKALRPSTILASIIHANNEIGTIQDLAAIGKVCHFNGTYFHTDASQSFGKIPIDVQRMNIDLLTASAHKIYGPKGVALFYKRKNIKIEPLLHGGGHENGLRSSTVNTPLIAGFALAAQIAAKDMTTENRRLSLLRNRLIDGMRSKVPHMHLNGHPSCCLPNIVNVSFDHIEGESLLLHLDMAGIQCSTGSACSSSSLSPSHVLTAIGLSPHQAHGSLRLSLGRGTAISDIDAVLKILPEAVNKLRELSPFKS